MTCCNISLWHRRVCGKHSHAKDSVPWCWCLPVFYHKYGPNRISSSWILSIFKTSDERTAVTALVQKLQVTTGESGLDCYMRFVTEDFNRNWSYSIPLKTYVSGSITLEMPDRLGVKIWMEGQGRGVEPPSFVFYYTRTNPWQYMELLTLQEHWNSGNPFISNLKNESVTNGPI